MLGVKPGTLSNLASGTLKLKVKEQPTLRKWMQRGGLLPESARRTHFFSGEDVKTIVEHRQQKKKRKQSKKRSRSEEKQSPRSEDIARNPRVSDDETLLSTAPRHR